jgi:hypothetical protein
MGPNNTQSEPHIPNFICASCGHQGRAKTYTKGSVVIELILWIFGLTTCFFLFFLTLLIPIVYSIWRLTSRYKACRQCRGPVIKADSPIGKRMLTDAANS